MQRGRPIFNKDMLRFLHLTEFIFDFDLADVEVCGEEEEGDKKVMFTDCRILTTDIPSTLLRKIRCPSGLIECPGRTVNRTASCIISLRWRFSFSDTFRK
jgi:hypothetical protein